MSGTITREQLNQKLESGRPFQLVEALSAEQYKQGHLPSATNLPPDQVKQLAASLLPDKQQEVVVYCASSTCNASENVARELTEMGYQNVLRYVGGKQDWMEAGLPLESKEKRAA